MLDRAQARAVSEMRNNDALACMFRRDTSKTSAHIFIREAVKTVPPDSTVRQFLRQSDTLRKRRLRAVKRGVEARDLRNVRRRGGDGLDGDEVVWLMQRSEWAKTFEQGQDM